MAVQEQNVEIDGLPIRYLTAGTGPPLVLLHGAGNNTLDWRWVMPHLAATHRVYAPDLPGSPSSARPAADYSPAFFERFVAAFVDALEIGRATFVDASDGGLFETVQGEAEVSGGWGIPERARARRAVAFAAFAGLAGASVVLLSRIRHAESLLRALRR